jgi:hypothetical protein
MSSEWMKPSEYRYYACELHALSWKCKELGFYDQFDYKPMSLSSSAIASKLILIPASYPKVFDKAALTYKLMIPVSTN